MIDRDDLRSDEEKIARAAGRAAAYKRADRLAVYAAVIAGGATAYYVFWPLGAAFPAVYDYAVPMLTVPFAAAWLARHVATVVMYRVEGLGDVPLFGVWGAAPPAADPAASADAHWPRVTAVPRLEPGQSSPGDAVIAAPLQDGPSTFASAGGRAGTPVDRLAIGVVAFTELGCVFYPDADAQLVRTLDDLTSVAWEFAKDTFKPLGVLDALGVGDSEPHAPSWPEWLERSRAHPQFYAFAWTELVEVRSGPDGIVAMSHEAADRARETHVFVAADPHWPVVLMKLRLKREMVDVLSRRVKQPLAEQLAPALIEQFRAIYGERLGDHARELYAELDARVTEAASRSDLPLDAIVRDALAPVLPHYAKIPPIVESHPILFPRAGS